MNTPVNFELAKLLKEKDFSTSKECAIYKDNTLIEIPKVYHLIIYDNCIKAPTIADVVMWLHEKHGIWIWVERYSTLFRPYAEEIGDEMFGKWEGHKFNSPTEAYAAAILYTLNSLI